MATSPGIVEQRIDAGSQWDESVPATSPVDAHDIRKYPSSTAGGQFLPDYANEDGSFESYVVEQIMVDFSDAASYEVAIINSDPVPVRAVLASGVGGVFLRVDPLYLAWDERLTLKSVGATGAMYGRVIMRPWRTRPA